MPVDVKSLPPAYQAQALRKYMEQQKKKGAAALSSAGEPRKGGKYHNKPTERVTAAGNVLRFDSQKEARRYDELTALEQAGKIRDLRLQVDFTLQEAYTDGEGRRVRAVRYRADFTYHKPADRREHGKRPFQYTVRHGYPWEYVVEDVKSRATRTKEYILKRKLMKERFGIDIWEV